jgi:serine protease Do
VLEAYKLTGQTAVQVGDVVKDTAADKAGIKAGDIIIKLDGKALHRGDEPDEAAAILLREVRRMKVGTEVTFSIMSSDDPSAAPHDVTLTLAQRPRMAHEAERFYAQDLGFTTREMVFDDTYARKLPADTKGVLVAMVKPSSAAQSGHLAGGDLITLLNREPVTDLAQFKKAYEAFRKEKPTEPVVLQVRHGVNTEVIRIEPPQ